MLPEERDAGYLWDMREAVRDCIEFAKDATYAQFSAKKSDAFSRGTQT